MFQRVEFLRIPVPTYDYQCKECGHAFEEFQSMSSDLLVICPNCAKPSLKRLMGGGAGMIFKGSGYYHTDYKNHGSPGGAPKPKADTKTNSKPESKTDLKSDSKTDSKPAPDTSKPSDAKKD